ncbi:MAG: hypothetical protein HWN66_08755 [Candidatus Helarchaeota archaeon]|nr:hypothetical protein [Candidatus Helarchaeota archaeon]
MKITELKEKEKVKFLTENHLLLQAVIGKFLTENYGEEELLKFLDTSIKNFGKVKFSGFKRKVITGVSKVTTSFLLEKGVENFLNNQTIWEKPKYLKIIEDSKHKKVIQIKKCNQKLRHRKIAKKIGVVDLEPEVLCKFRCKSGIIELEEVLPKFQGKIEYQEKGCIMTFIME